MEEGKGEEEDVVEGQAGYTIQFVIGQMLYPQARYFTPNGTSKNSIC